MHHARSAAIALLVFVFCAAALPPACTGPRDDLSSDMTWQWQLTGAIDTSYDVDIYDIDLFDTPARTIDELHGDDRIVLCYFSAGSYESWRADADSFAATDLGRPLDGWPGERWLDIRSARVRKIMERRLDQAMFRGCNGVEPDNVDGYQNDTGLPLTARDQLAYNRFLAAEAHERNLHIALKNDVAQIPQLVDHFDLAVNEECQQWNECDAYAPFVAAGKPVLGTEYAKEYRNDPAAACRTAERNGISLLILPLDLDDSFRISCN